MTKNGGTDSSAADMASALCINGYIEIGRLPVTP